MVQFSIDKWKTYTFSVKSFDVKHVDLIQKENLITVLDNSLILLFPASIAFMVWSYTQHHLKLCLTVSKMFLYSLFMHENVDAYSVYSLFKLKYISNFVITFKVLLWTHSVMRPNIQTAGTSFGDMILYWIAGSGPRIINLFETSLRTSVLILVYSFPLFHLKLYLQNLTQNVCQQAKF